MLFSGKENVFMCLAVTKFVLRKINSGVWFIQTFLQKMHQIRQKKQNLAKENESTTSDERFDRRSTSGAIAVRRVTSDEWCDRGATSDERCDERRATSGAIVDRRARSSDDRTARSHRS